MSCANAMVIKNKNDVFQRKYEWWGMDVVMHACEKTARERIYLEGFLNDQTKMCIPFPDIQYSQLKVKENDKSLTLTFLQKRYFS